MYFMGPNGLVLNPARAFLNVLVSGIISVHPEVNFIFFKCLQQIYFRNAV